MDSMQGKRVVITGPTSGIGREIAKELAALQAELVLGCRDIHRGERVAAEISHETDCARITVMLIDTSEQQSIRAFARQYRDNFARLDVLVNNAGVNLAEQPRQQTREGVELTFATNVMGYYLLTLELLDILKASVPSRIVNVASTFASDLDLDDVQFERRPYNGMRAYAQSKACDRLLTWALARRLEGTGVAVNAMAPGLVPGTSLFRHMATEALEDLQKRGGATVPDGADTALWLASSSELEGLSGKFFAQRKELSCQFKNLKDEEQLWSVCERLVV